jgi:hypothetical protein
MRNYRLHRDFGSALNGIYTLIIFAILFHFFGTAIISDVILGFISVAVAYPLVGLTLRGLGIWTRN